MRQVSQKRLQEVFGEPVTTPKQGDMLPDTSIAPYVVELNDAGIETVESCSGHTNPAKLGYVMFEATDRFNPTLACRQNEFEEVSRIYRECGDLYKVVFTGLSDSHGSLSESMEALLTHLGVSGDNQKQ